MKRQLPAILASRLPALSTTTQTDNQAGGHVAARDVNVQEVHGDYVNHAPVDRPTQLGRLYKKMKEKAEGDIDLSEYISQLEIFTRSVEDEHVVGLDGKLAAAGRQDQLAMAKAMKEVIYSQLRQNLFSKTFQTIYATLMAKIFEEFNHWVRPAVLHGMSREEIDVLVHDKVVLPIAAELEQCSDFDGVAVIEIRGMIYFLTGNCHLCWC